MIWVFTLVVPWVWSVATLSFLRYFPLGSRVTTLGFPPASCCFPSVSITASCSCSHWTAELSRAQSEHLSSPGSVPLSVKTSSRCTVVNTILTLWLLHVCCWPWPFPDPQSHMSNCPLNTYSRVSKKHFEINLPKTELLMFQPSKLTFPPLTRFGKQQFHSSNAYGKNRGASQTPLPDLGLTSLYLQQTYQLYRWIPIWPLPNHPSWRLPYFSSDYSNGLLTDILLPPFHLKSILQTTVRVSSLKHRWIRLLLCSELVSFFSMSRWSPFSGLGSDTRPPLLCPTPDTFPLAPLLQLHWPPHCPFNAPNTALPLGLALAAPLPETLFRLFHFGLHCLFLQVSVHTPLVMPKLCFLKFICSNPTPMWLCVEIGPLGRKLRLNGVLIWQDGCPVRRKKIPAIPWFLSLPPTPPHHLSPQPPALPPFPLHPPPWEQGQGHVRTQQEGTVYMWGREALPETSPDNNLSLDVDAPEQWGNTFLLGKLPCLWFSVTAVLAD